jgi:hypothetical protein
LQPSGQPFELLVCAEFVQAVNADLNRLGVVVGDTVDVLGAAHDLLSSPSVLRLRALPQGGSTR